MEAFPRRRPGTPRQHERAGALSAGPLARRVLRRGHERHHLVLLVLPAGELDGELRVRHGPPVQVHRGHVGPDGVRELCLGVPVRYGSQEQDASPQVATPVLHLHRKKVEEGPEGSVCGPPRLVRQSPDHRRQAFH